MGKDKNTDRVVTVAGSRAVLTDQRAEAVTPTPEIRRGINVLVTSDPDHPAPNPFVHGSTEASNGGNSQPNSGNSDTKSEGDK